MTAYGSGVVVPNVGWVIFGGLSSCLPTAQELVALDSSWQPGPLLPVPNDPDYSGCLVQVKVINRGFL
jgi:hypothetical protein